MFALALLASVIPEDPSALFDMAVSLVQNQNYRALAALIIIAVVRYGGPLLATKAPFFATAKGKATLVILIALLTGIFDAFLPGAVPAVAVLVGAIKNAMAAAGGFSLFRAFFPSQEAK